MATYPTGSGKTYTTIADAIAAVVAAVGSTPATEAHYIDLYGGATFSETVTIPLYSDCSCTRSFPLVIRTATGESISTIQGQLGMSGPYACYFEYQDVIMTGFELNLNYNDRGMTFRNVSATIADAGAWTNQYNGLISFVDSVLDITTRIGYATGRCVSFSFVRCKIRTTNLIIQYYTSGTFGRTEYVNCKIIGPGTGSGNLHDCGGGSAFVFVSLRIIHCSIYGFKDVSYCKRVDSIEIKNNIFDTIGSVLNSYDIQGFNTKNITADGNRYYNVTKIIDSPFTDYSNLSAMQSEGWETYGTEGDPGFVSTTWGNAGFLKLSASLASAKNVGIYEDEDGTLMEKWSDIDPGAHQFEAATEDSGGGGAQLGAFENGAWR